MKHGLGAARLDHLDGGLWVHEIKSSSRVTDADRAQVIHYCHQLHRVGVPAKGGVLHYPKTRRTTKVTYGPDAVTQAERDIATVLSVANLRTSPPRLSRSACRGCSYLDYCWTD